MGASLTVLHKEIVFELYKKVFGEGLLLTVTFETKARDQLYYFQRYEKGTFSKKR